MSEFTKLCAVDQLADTGVTTVSTSHGKLAVGVAGDEPFAVSDRCRHLGASLGHGRIAEDGCLECPWHRARYDVTTGKMTRGPQGAVFLALRGTVRVITNLVARLKRFPVARRDGEIDLIEP